MMKKRNLITLLGATLLVAALALISCSSDDGVMSKKKGVYTVNTTTLSQDVKGYNGPTPLLIEIKKDRVVSVTALENQETPRFFQRVVDGKLLESWNGKSVDEVLSAKVDVVSGATYSSQAVIENVMRGVTYYKEHK